MSDEKETLVYDVEGDFTLRNGNYWCPTAIELVVKDTTLHRGRKARDIVLRLTKNQWTALAQLTQQAERRRNILEVARAEMDEFSKNWNQDHDEFKKALIHKLGLDDWPTEDLPSCLR